MFVFIMFKMSKPPGESNVILGLLAKSVEKLRNEGKQKLLIEETSTRENKKRKKFIEDADPQDARKLSVGELTWCSIT